MTAKRFRPIIMAGALILVCGTGAIAQAPANALQQIVQAKAAVARKDWPAAIEFLSAVTTQTPDNGAYRLMLADARLANGDYARAAGDYARALELGTEDPALLNYQIAKCHALGGEKPAALAALKQAMALGYRDLETARSDPAFAALRGDPDYRALLGIVDPTAMSRDEGWRSDIRFLADWVEKKSLHPFRTETADRALSSATLTREEFEAQITKMIADVPALSDGAIKLALVRLVASLGDGHTELSPSSGKDHPLTLPLGFYIFDDGVHVISAAPRYKSLLGAKIIAVDGTPIGAILPKLDGLIAHDNTMWLTTQEPYLLRSTELLTELGIARASDAVTLTVERADGPATDVKAEADTSQPNIWNMLPKPAAWAWIGDGSRADFQKDNNRPYWMRWDAASGILYVQYNNVFNAKDETLAAFAARLGAALAHDKVDKLVIDMRNNNGGNTYLNEPLLKVVEGSAKVNRLGHLYVIIGRRTFSAAMNAVSYFGKYTNALFVGEPTGGKPNAPGDETFFTLPYSGLSVNLSDRYWQGTWPDDFSTWKAPDIAVPVTFADIAAGRDAAMAAIRAQNPPN